MSIEIEQGKLYDIDCPECGHEILCGASYYQMTGHYAAGHGDCPDCGTAMQLTYQPETGNMVAAHHSIFIDPTNTIH